MLRVKKNSAPSAPRAQTIVEYLLLLAVVVAIILIGFKKFVPRAGSYSELYYNRVSLGIMGEAPSCGDGECRLPENNATCCVDCPKPIFPAITSCHN